MDIVIFILFIFLLMFPKSIVYKLAESGEVAAAYILGIGMLFINPFPIIWFANYLFDYHISYWTAFAFVIVFKALKYEYEPID